MGLDMYVYKTSQTLNAEVDFDFEEDDFELVHQWRKHPNLHGWMESLYRRKGGQEDVFNCTNVALSYSDLDQLENEIKSDTLPLTNGFFFGESDGTEREDDLAFIAKAKEALNDGFRVFYRPWW